MKNINVIISSIIPSMIPSIIGYSICSRGTVKPQALLKARI